MEAVVNRYIPQLFTSDFVREPLYRLELPLLPYERELLQSPPLRRLKHLHHFGAGALVSPVTHSRLEHTLGVWALAKHFFPAWTELHAAALLHDIGHLPFSHAAELPLGFDHHAQTEELIRAEPVAAILARHGISAEAVVALLNRDTPLSHRSQGLSLDHLDSFFRDTHAAGLDSAQPHELVARLRFEGCCASADEATARHVWHTVCADNRLFLSPELLAADAVLSQAVAAYLHATAADVRAVARMSDAQLLAALEACGWPDVSRPLNALLREPHRIARCSATADGAFRVAVRKAYVREPLVDGSPLSERCPDALAQKTALAELAAEYWFRIA